MATSSFFRLTVTRANGSAVAGATLVLLDSQGVDQTDVLLSNLLGTSVPAVTNASGVIYKQWPRTPISNAPITLLTPGQYTLVVSHPTYGSEQITTSSTFKGIGEFSVVFTRNPSTEGYDVAIADQVYVSPLAPITAQVESPLSGQWELITATVTHSDGRSSVQRIQVDPVSLMAKLDVRNRVFLPARLTLVPDGKVATPDKHFSDQITLLFKSVTDDGEVSLEEPLTRYVANMWPPGKVNDLTEFTPQAGKPARWITRLARPVVNRGYYADAMLWLPTAGTYTLNKQFKNANGVVVGPTTTADFEAGVYVQRIRLDSNPLAGVTTGHYWVSQGGTAVSQTLIVDYRG